MVAACSGDVVTDRYATLQDARADEVFGRGWLPDVLPPSSHDIRTSNDLDLNTSVGEFSFLPGEFELLRRRLLPYANPDDPFTDAFDSKVARHVSAGHPGFSEHHNGSTRGF